MTRQLALTLPHHHMETPASYVARLSRRNLSVAREFCSDLGLRWPHICSAHPDQLERLSQLAGVPLEALELAAARLVGPCRYRVGHSFATSGSFRRATTRI